MNAKSRLGDKRRSYYWDPVPGFDKDSTYRDLKKQLLDDIQHYVPDYFANQQDMALDDEKSQLRKRLDSRWNRGSFRGNSDTFTGKNDCTPFNIHLDTYTLQIMAISIRSLFKSWLIIDCARYLHVLMSERLQGPRHHRMAHLQRFVAS